MLNSHFNATLDFRKFTGAGTYHRAAAVEPFQLLRQNSSPARVASSFRRYKVYQHIRKGSPLDMALNETGYV